VQFPRQQREKREKTTGSIRMGEGKGQAYVHAHTHTHTHSPDAIFLGIKAE
jgi:hypothetical protein